MPRSSLYLTALAAACVVRLALMVTPEARGQPSSRVWSIVTRGTGDVEQSEHEVYTGSSAHSRRFTLRPARVGFYRVLAYAESTAVVTATLTTAGRPAQGTRRINTGETYATEWLICTSATNSPIVLEIRTTGAAEWAFTFHEPPTSIPIFPPCR